MLDSKNLINKNKIDLDHNIAILEENMNKQLDLNIELKTCINKAGKDTDETSKNIESMINNAKTEISKSIDEIDNGYKNNFNEIRDKLKYNSNKIENIETNISDINN